MSTDIHADRDDTPGEFKNDESFRNRTQAGVEFLRGQFEEVDAGDEVTPDEQVAEPKGVVATAPAPTNGEADSGMAAVARAEARGRELFDKREKELEAKEQKLSESMAKIEQFEQLRSRARENPLAVVQELAGPGTNAEDLVGTMYSSLAGVEGEARTSGEVDSLKARLDRMEKENSEYREQAAKTQQQKEQDTFQRDYLGQISGFLGSEETGKDDDLSYVAAYYAGSPDSAKVDVFNMAGQLAAQNPEGPLIRPDEAARKLNEHLSKVFGPMVKVLLEKQSEGKTQAAPVSPPADNRTLTNAASQITQPNTKRQMTRQERTQRATAWAKQNLKFE